MGKAIAVIALYTAGMAAGLYYVRNFRGVEYADPAFIQTFFWVLVVLASATVAYCLVFREEAAIPWARTRL